MKKMIKWILLFLVVVLLYMIVGAVVPYLIQPKVSDTYKESFDTSAFYSDKVSVDRATVIEDNGPALEERIRLISQAKERVILSSFDFRSDEAGKQVIAALFDAALRGIQVQVLVDGFNTRLRMEGDPYFYALSTQPGVEIKIYNPIQLFTPWKWMSRLHDKYVIKDEEAYILGGRNTVSFFLGDQEGYKNYDRDVLVYNTGDKTSSLYQVLDYFNKVWNQRDSKTWHDFVTNKEKTAKKEKVIAAGEELTQLYADMKTTHPDWFEQKDYKAMTLSTNKITLLSNPTKLYSKEPQLFYALMQLMKQAKQEVIVHTPYIMCNNMMYSAFTEVCKEDAKVTLMTNSVKNNANPFGSVDYALNKTKISNTGLQILEYEGGISYHGKSLTIDDDIAIVGSFNMDMKSVYQDTELMLVINSTEVNKQLKENLQSYQVDAKETDPNKDEVKALFDKSVPLGKRIEWGIIRVLDPLLRFIL